MLCGLLLVAAGAVLGLTGTPEPADSGPSAAGVLVLFVCVLVASWKLFRTPDDPSVSPSPWTADDKFTEGFLETTPTDDAVSGTELAERVEAAAAQARDDGSVAESVGPVREPLRAALTEALVQGGHDPDSVKAQLAAGTWTDDPVAAAVLDESVTPPDRPFRTRLWAWLFPEKAVRKRCARAMTAVSVAADNALRQWSASRRRVRCQSSPQRSPTCSGRLTGASSGPSTGRFPSGKPSGPAQTARLTVPTSTEPPPRTQLPRTARLTPSLKLAGQRRLTRTERIPQRPTGPTGAM